MKSMEWWSGDLTLIAGPITNAHFDCEKALSLPYLNLK